jgi:spore coat polysaccharide biosynthesis protein SpsF
MNIAGEPMLARVLRRMLRATTLDEVVVATTIQRADDGIADLCLARGWKYFRGSEDDVLDRYYQAAIDFNSEAIVRVTSDCPLIDPDIVDRVVHEFLKHQPKVDYVSNALPKTTFPRGLDTEVMRFDVLKRAWVEDANPLWREHVSAFILRHPDLFRLHGIVNDVDLSYMRWTVDTAEDLELIQRIFASFGHDQFSWHDVVSLLAKNSHWLTLNQHVKQKTIPKS